jgi:hypothetical protein
LDKGEFILNKNSTRKKMIHKQLPKKQDVQKPMGTYVRKQALSRKKKKKKKAKLKDYIRKILRPN